MSMIESLLKTMPEDGAGAGDCAVDGNGDGDGDGDGAGVTAGGMHASNDIPAMRKADCLNPLIRNLRL